MRHPISPNQLVMWPHHELTQTWAPTGILNPPPQMDVTTADHTAHGVGQNEDAGEMNRGIDPAPAQAATTVLTRASGACGQVNRNSRRAWRGRRGGTSTQRQARLHDLM
jgi:hypothetical protein